jgi:multidrug efflux pump subunit AcrB
MKGITDFALNNSRTVILIMLGIIIGGIYQFKDLPKLEDPTITIREAVVMAQNPGNIRRYGHSNHCALQRWIFHGGNA